MDSQTFGYAILLTFWTFLIYLIWSEKSAKDRQDLYSYNNLSQLNILRQILSSQQEFVKQVTQKPATRVDAKKAGNGVAALVKELPKQ